MDQARDDDGGILADFEVETFRAICTVIFNFGQLWA